MVVSSLNFFLFHTFEFERNNLEYLEKLIHLEDRKDLSLNFKDATFLGMTLSLPEGSPFYDWKIDKKSQLERQSITHRRRPRSYNIIICKLFHEHKNKTTQFGKTLRKNKRIQSSRRCKESPAVMDSQNNGIFSCKKLHFDPNFCESMPAAYP
ncbi:hypothetical protein AVEN_108546-1 [Araneus ventricosus]|uniref:Uncharacterized protein n=1 Tax=Araneus ventricosus TaxID=182803 RepID=A0A4Y2M9D6_ARAVE|nr:hypothetical protein AVEN_108546-1 [Araneus ventricosus]